MRQHDARRWEILDPFVFRLGSPTGIEYVYVPAGFLTDFASIPRVLWSLWPPTGAYGKAAVVHDALYAWPYVRRVDGPSRRVTKAEADRILLAGMQVLGIGWMTQQVLYRGVQVGGGLAWRAHRRRPLDRR